MREPFGLRVVRYFRDPNVAFWRKGVMLFAAAYAALPFDAVSDLIPVLGWLDDLGVVTAATWFMWRELRRHAVPSDSQ
ncbi:MAG: YkvA family protein [Myxococcaceae bacterium]